MKICGGDENQILFNKYTQYYLRHFPSLKENEAQAFANISIYMTSLPLLHPGFEELEKRVSKKWPAKVSVQAEEIIDLLNQGIPNTESGPQGGIWPFMSKEAQYPDLTKIHTNGVLGEVLLEDEQLNGLNILPPALAAIRPVPKLLGRENDNKYIKRILENNFIFSEKADLPAIVLHGKETIRLWFFLMRWGIRSKLIDIGDLTPHEINKLLINTENLAENKSLLHQFLNNSLSHTKDADHPLFQMLTDPKTNAVFWHSNPYHPDAEIKPEEAEIMREKIANNEFAKNGTINAFLPPLLSSYLMLNQTFPHLQVIHVLDFNKNMYKINRTQNYLSFDFVKCPGTQNKYIAVNAKFSIADTLKRLSQECDTIDSLSVNPIYQFKKIAFNAANKTENQEVPSPMLSIPMHAVTSAYPATMKQILFPVAEEKQLSTLLDPKGSKLLKLDIPNNDNKTYFHETGNICVAFAKKPYNQMKKSSSLPEKVKNNFLLTGSMGKFFSDLCATKLKTPSFFITGVKGLLDQTYPLSNQTPTSKMARDKVLNLLKNIECMELSLKDLSLLNRLLDENKLADIISILDAAVAPTKTVEASSEQSSSMCTR